MANDWKNGDPNWRRMEAMARRGWNRLAAGMEGNDWLGGNFRIGRMLAAGDIRLVALYLIEQQPRHGYDLIKAIEEKSGGFYAPSPGVVYPALTFLEEAGFVTSQSEGNKKLYTITPEGRTHLADNREAIESTLSFLHKAGEQMSRFREFARADWPVGRGEAAGQGHGAQSAHYQSAEPADRDLQDVVPELNDARRTLKAAIKTARKASPDQQRRAAEILRKAARDIEALGEDDEVDL